MILRSYERLSVQPSYRKNDNQVAPTLAHASASHHSDKCPPLKTNPSKRGKPDAKKMHDRHALAL